jgi:hypothetical protein
VNPVVGAGYKIDLNKEDLFNIEAYQYGTVAVANPTEKHTSTLAKNKLIEKFGQEGFDRISVQLSRPSTGLNVVLNKAYESMPIISKAVSTKYDKLKSIINAEDNKTFSLNEDQQKNAKNQLISLLTGNEKLSGPDFDKDKIAKALAEEASTVSITAISPKSSIESWRGVVYITDKEGKTRGIDITQEDLSALSSTSFNPYRESAAEVFIRSKGTTNMFGQTYLKGAEQGVPD